MPKPRCASAVRRSCLSRKYAYKLIGAQPMRCASLRMLSPSGPSSARIARASASTSSRNAARCRSRRNSRTGCRRWHHPSSSRTPEPSADPVQHPPVRRDGSPSPSRRSLAGDIAARQPRLLTTPVSSGPLQSVRCAPGDAADRRLPAAAEAAAAAERRSNACPDLSGACCGTMLARPASGLFVHRDVRAPIGRRVAATPACAAADRTRLSAVRQRRACALIPAAVRMILRPRSAGDAALRPDPAALHA